MDLIRKNFGLRSLPSSEDELISWLTDRIAQMLDHESDLLWSTLYRLDISEEKIKSVLKGPDHISIPEGLARLVLDRQKDKMTLRSNYHPSDFDFGWSDE